MQALGSFALEICYTSPCPQAAIYLVTTEVVKCIAALIQIDVQRRDVRGRERRGARTREPEELTKMMHGQRRHETVDRDHGWNRQRRGEQEGGRDVSLSEGLRHREELCSGGGCAHLFDEGHCSELRQTGERESHTALFPPSV